MIMTNSWLRKYQFASISRRSLLVQSDSNGRELASSRVTPRAETSHRKALGFQVSGSYKMLAKSQRRQRKAPEVVYFEPSYSGVYSNSASIEHVEMPTKLQVHEEPENKRVDYKSWDCRFNQQGTVDQMSDCLNTTQKRSFTPTSFVFISGIPQTATESGLRAFLNQPAVRSIRIIQGVAGRQGMACVSLGIIHDADDFARYYDGKEVHGMKISAEPDAQGEKFRRALCSLARCLSNCSSVACSGAESLERDGENPCETAKLYQGVVDGFTDRGLKQKESDHSLKGRRALNHSVQRRRKKELNDSVQHSTSQVLQTDAGIFGHRKQGRSRRLKNKCVEAQSAAPTGGSGITVSGKLPHSVGHKSKGKASQSSVTKKRARYFDLHGLVDSCVAIVKKRKRETTACEERNTKTSRRAIESGNEDNVLWQGTHEVIDQDDGTTITIPQTVKDKMISAGIFNNDRVAVTDLLMATSRKQFLWRDSEKADNYRYVMNEVSRNMAVMHSQIHGLGVFPRFGFEKGNFIAEYTGKTVPEDEADAVESEHQRRGIDGCYLFKLPNGDCIDATDEGAEARYFNHCCQPNCEAMIVPLNGEYRIILYANRDISSKEELTVNYAFDVEKDVKKKIRCKCKAGNCNGFMN